MDIELLHIHCESRDLPRSKPRLSLHCHQLLGLVLMAGAAECATDRMENCVKENIDTKVLLLDSVEVSL